MIHYKSLTSLILFPSFINSISLRLKIKKNFLALSGSVPCSWKSWIFLGVMKSGWCLRSIISKGYFVFISRYDIGGFHIGSAILSLKKNFKSLYCRL